jgi:hypothetical protein
MYFLEHPVGTPGSLVCELVWYFQDFHMVNLHTITMYATKHEGTSRDAKRVFTKYPTPKIDEYRCLYCVVSFYGAVMVIIVW